MEYLSEVIAFLAGLGAGWTLRIVVSHRSIRSEHKTFVSQKGNKAGGNIVAGDLNQRDDQ